MEDAILKKIKLLEDEVKALKTQRIIQSMIVPDAVKTRHLGEPNRYFLSGLEADRPTGAEVTGGVTYFFATDSFKLFVYTGSAWKSVTLA